jgi:hypothetical protein
LFGVKKILLPMLCPLLRIAIVRSRHNTHLRNGSPNVIVIGTIPGSQIKNVRSNVIIFEFTIVGAGSLERGIRSHHYTAAEKAGG